jgi:hypothetical protein
MLSYADLLDLLGYGAGDRHPLEVLGYERSSLGVERFRRERPDLLSEAVRLIEVSLEEAGAFPRDLTPEERAEGAYLVQRPDGAVSLYRGVETGISQTAHGRFDFASAREAIHELLRRRADPAYLRVPPS